MTEVIEGLIGFMDEGEPLKGGDDKRKKEECAAHLRKRPREETYETLEPRMKRLQLKLAEGPQVRRRFSRKFWRSVRSASNGIAVQGGCKGAELLTVNDLDRD